MINFRNFVNWWTERNKGKMELKIRWSERTQRLSGVLSRMLALDEVMNAFLSDIKGAVVGREEFTKQSEQFLADDDTLHSKFKQRMISSTVSRRVSYLCRMHWRDSWANRKLWTRNCRSYSNDTGNRPKTWISQNTSFKKQGKRRNWTAGRSRME